MDRPRARRLALYAGGFLGPFGGGVLAVLIPQLREAFAASADLVTAGTSAYLVPFAALQLVSGTLGEPWGLALYGVSPALAFAAAGGVTLALAALLVPLRGAPRARRPDPRVAAYGLRTTFVQSSSLCLNMS